jgi:RimJ/RimL family protein N-acetyltransferase
MEQLILRQWKDSDLEPYAAMNADREVMRHFPALLTNEETAAFMERQRHAIDERGWGLWAVEVDGVFAGSTPESASRSSRGDEAQTSPLSQPSTSNQSEPPHVGCCDD